MPDLAPFHSGQVENFYLLVLGQVQMYEAKLGQKKIVVFQMTLRKKSGSVGREKLFFFFFFFFF